MAPRRLALTAVAAALTFGVAACGGKAEPNEPEPPPPPVDLSGIPVMLIPARPGEPASVDRDLAARLKERAPGTDWILPARIDSTIRANPATRFNLAAPRRVVEVARGGRRVLDPLYGDLRILGAILNAPVALVPVGTRARTDALGTTVELTAVLVDIRGGRVAWMYTATGGPSETTDAAVAEAVSLLAATLIRGDG